MKIYKCTDGREYVYFKRKAIKVDKLIEFLEKHRGKIFHMDAVKRPAVLIGDETVQFAELDFFTEVAEEYEDEWLAKDIFAFCMEEEYRLLTKLLNDEPDERLADEICAFFKGENEDSIAYEDDRRQKIDDDADEDGDEQLSIDGFFDKEGDE